MNAAPMNANPLLHPFPGTLSKAGMRRRHLVAVLLVTAAAGGCGFQLRGSGTYHFSSAFINTGPYAAFGNELRRALELQGGIKLMPGPDGAEVVLDLVRIVDDKQVLSLSTGGRVQEYELQKAIFVRVRDGNGGVWMSDDNILIRRTFVYDDSQRLAREMEEQRLLRDMQTDAVAQVIRRLQAARPPARPPA